MNLNGVNGHAALLPTIESGNAERPSGKVTSKAILKLLDVQQKRCALTGVELTPQTVSLDHIEPVGKGGGDTMENVQLVHATINTMKGTMSQEEFIKWCRLVAEHAECA